MKNKFGALSDMGAHSRAEARRKAFLQQLERAGVIRALEAQVPVLITPEGCPARYLIVDFSYVTCTGFDALPAEAIVYEDCKSPATETPLWRLKWLLARHYRPDCAWVTSYARRNRWQIKLWPAPPKR